MFVSHYNNDGFLSQLNARGNLLDMCPKVECSEHIGRVPTLVRTTGLFDSPANDGLVLVK